MKKALLFSLTVFLFVLSGLAKEVKVLTIGNSFSYCLWPYLPMVADSASGCTLVIDGANHGGHSLQQHWNLVFEEERNDDVRLYKQNKKKLREILSAGQWDLVVIQQASFKSFDADTYFPYADKLKSYIAKHAPEAKIAIQQTWSYRIDAPEIAPGNKWGLNQQTMFNGIEEACAQAAEKLGAQIIPVGKAVQLAREKQPVKFKEYDPDILKGFSWPDFPSQAGSLVGWMEWQKNKDGELYIFRDTKHLNERGRYLQACVWFAFLFDESTEKITFVPETLSDDDAKFLRQIAQEAVDSYK